MTFSWLLVYASVLTCLLLSSIFFNIRFVRSLLKVQDSIEESLDTLDQSFISVTKILERPVFFDSVEVRQVINEINRSRDAVLYVANILGQVEVADSNFEEERR